MPISRTIWVILTLFMWLCLETLIYIIERFDPRYVKGAMVLNKIISGNSNAVGTTYIIITQLFHTVIEGIVICKEEYIHISKTME